jgi:hypothetical protein
MIAYFHSQRRTSRRTNNLSDYESLLDSKRITMSLRETIENWYQGELITNKYGPRDSLVFIGGTYKRHWTACFARMLAEFWLNHWKWAIGTMIAVCGLALTLTRH